MSIDPFERRRLGRTGVFARALGLGTGPLGGWPSAVSDEQGRATIEAAWARGLRHFDTAPFYGHGLSERWLGEVLASRPRDAFILSTKVGRLLVPGEEQSLFQGVPPVKPVLDFSAAGILQSLAESRERLGIDRLDVAMIHDPDDHFDQAVAEAYPALAELRSRGDIGAIGVGMNWSEPLARFAEAADFDCFLLAGRYTLLEQNALDELLPLCIERGISVIAGGVYNSGLLVDPRPGATYNYAPAEERLLAHAQRLEAVCAEFHVPLRAAAIQFPLAHPAVASVVVGARTPAEIDDNLAVIGHEIPHELWTTLKERELLRGDAPTPAPEGQ